MTTTTTELRRCIGSAKFGIEPHEAPADDFPKQPSQLATPGAQDAGTEALPGPRAVQRVVAAAVRLPGVLSAATTGTARGDTADRAQLHHLPRTA